MRKYGMFALLPLAIFGLVLAQPAFAGSKWSLLKDVDKNLAHLRGSGLFPVVTGLTCQISKFGPRIRFTYTFSKTMVRYNYAYSTKGKAAYDKIAKRYLTAKSKIVSCDSGDFYYGVQNLVK